MENKNYYDILGVAASASSDDIAAAKNQLAKKFHPDANLRHGIDTTTQMQEILEAYRILSDPELRAGYDRSLQGHRSAMQTFDLRDADEDFDESRSAFVNYWKAAGELYDIITESDQIFKARNRTSRLTQLSAQAMKRILVLHTACIPERYWYPDIMNWLLFTWYQNRNYTVNYLLELYDEYAKTKISAVDRLKLQHRSHQFHHSLKRLIKY